ncbi:MAG: hypothetical protein ACOC3Z_01095 [Nanoarchaeota archaeon]
MEEIIREKTSADHLLYVSLKYTKTCDIILNLISRWRKMIDTCMEKILEKAVENGKIQSVPDNPIRRVNETKKLFKKDKDMQDVLDLYLMFRKIRELKRERIGEFRKNVNLKVQFKGEEVNINLEQLKEYASKLEKFISSTKQFLSK